MTDRRLPPPGNLRGEYRCPRCNKYLPREQFALVLTGNGKHWRCAQCRQKKASA